MSDADFASISALIHRQTGIVIGPAKRSLLISRLSRRLRLRALGSFADYRVLLDGPDGEEERRALVSAITTNVTRFFREPAHFDAMSDLMPPLVARARSGGRIRIWSAGCSTGQEPYTISITLLDRWPELSGLDVRILATDIDPEVVATARAGVYAQTLVEDDAPPALRRFLEPGPAAGTVRITAPPRRLLRFEELNLLQDWPFRGSFDLIFCRNVVIYFDAETRRALWRRFAERLPPGGWLYVGHSERLDAALDPYLEPAGITRYRRTGLVIQPADRPSGTAVSTTPLPPVAALASGSTAPPKTLSSVGAGAADRALTPQRPIA
jgi:chemotaxis protein methyltransferase CheR